MEYYSMMWSLICLTVLHYRTISAQSTNETPTQSLPIREAPVRTFVKPTDLLTKMSMLKKVFITDYPHAGLSGSVYIKPGAPVAAVPVDSKPIYFRSQGMPAAQQPSNIKLKENILYVALPMPVESHEEVQKGDLTN